MLLFNWVYKIMNKLNNFFNHLTNISISLIKQFLIIFLYIIMNIFLSLVFFKDIKNSNLCNILISLIVFIIFLIIFRKSIFPKINDFKENGKKYLKENLKYYIIGLIIMIISNMIINIFISPAANEVNAENILMKLPVYSILNMLIFAPIVEELMTRGVLKDTFKHLTTYAIISGLIFGFLHVMFSIGDNILELFYIIPYGILGSMFAIMYYKTDNIWTNIFYHFLHNFLCILIVFISMLLGA